jgi:WD40 repeat protein
MQSLLAESPDLQAVSSPLRSTKISSDAYVLFLEALSSHYAAAASAPSNTIDLFDKSTLHLVQTLTGHDTATTCLRTSDTIAASACISLVSSGKDGTVKLWDERSNSASTTSEHITAPSAPLCLFFDSSTEAFVFAQ